VPTRTLIATLSLLLAGAPAFAQGSFGAPPTAPLPIAPPMTYRPTPEPPPDAEAEVFGYRAGGRWLLTVDLGAGLEPHIPSSSSGYPIGMPPAFTVGGAALWRGLVGPALALYSSEGVALTAGFDLPGLADRVSAVFAVAVRPLAPLAWRAARSGDAYLARFLDGVGVEIGPSVEYYRSASIDPTKTVNGMSVPACPDVPSEATHGALHVALTLEAPLGGSARTGWVAVRGTARFIVSDEARLAPTPTCQPQVVERGAASQLLVGLAYYL